MLPALEKLTISTYQLNPFSPVCESYTLALPRKYLTVDDHACLL